MAIKGSVRVASGTLSVTFPFANMLVVGIQAVTLSATLGQVITIALDAAKNAVIPLSGDVIQVNPTIIPVHFQVAGQTFSYTLAAASDVIFYFGDSALPNSLPLTAYAGVLVSSTQAGAGTVTLTFTFPSKVKLTGFVAWTSSSNTQLSFPIDVGQTLTIEVATLHTTMISFLNSPVFPISGNAPTTLSVTAVFAAAATTNLILYYDVGSVSK